MRKAGHETDSNRVSADHDDWDCAGRLLNSEARRRAPGDDGVGRQANQLGGKGGIALCATVREPVLEMHVLFFDVAEPAQPISQAFERRPRLIGKNANATDLVSLSHGSEWPRHHRAAKNRNELPPLHAASPGAKGLVAPDTRA